MSSTPIRLMSFNPQWKQEFEQTKSSLLQATEGWLTQVEHIGSTSIANGIAQPIVDVLAGMDDIRGLNEASTLVEGLNYKRVSSPEWCSDEVVAYLQKPRVGEVTHTVLIVRRDGEAWRRAIAIRKTLAQNLVLWQRLQSLKQDNFTSGCQATQKYDLAKKLFFEELEAEFRGD